jgi:hypothetical protein
MVQSPASHIFDGVTAWQVYCQAAVVSRQRVFDRRRGMQAYQINVVLTGCFQSEQMATFFDCEIANDCSQTLGLPAKSV